VASFFTCPFWGFYFFTTFYASINGNLVQFMKNKLSCIRPDNSKYPAGYRIVQFCHYPARYYIRCTPKKIGIWCLRGWIHHICAIKTTLRFPREVRPLYGHAYSVLRAFPFYPYSIVVNRFPELRREDPKMTVCTKQSQELLSLVRLVVAYIIIIGYMYILNCVVWTKIMGCNP
jgi:hypothetical protein